MVSPKCRTHLCPRYASQCPSLKKTYTYRNWVRFPQHIPTRRFFRQPISVSWNLNAFSSLIAAAFCQLIATSRFWHSSCRHLFGQQHQFWWIFRLWGLGLISTVLWRNFFLPQVLFFVSEIELLHDDTIRLIRI